MNLIFVSPIPYPEQRAAPLPYRQHDWVLRRADRACNRSEQGWSFFRLPRQFDRDHTGILSL